MTLREGDKVRVVRMIDSWSSNGWVREMSRYINDGNIYTISRVSANGSDFFLVEDDDNWAWPEKCFQVVPSSPLELMQACLPDIVHEGETLVQVVSPVGSVCGVFCWPTDQLSLFEQSNAGPFGYYFAWRKDNDLSKPHTAPLPDGIKQGLTKMDGYNIVAVCQGEVEVAANG